MQFKYSIFLFICSIVFILAACDLNYTPEPYTGVSGIVRDKTTGECIPNATIYLLESGDSPGAGYYYKDSLVTDVYGNFEFEFEKIIGYGYALLANKEHYIESTGLTFIQYGEIKDVLLSPEGYIKLHVQNILPSEPWDQLGINGPFTAHFYGNEIDSLMTFQINGNTNIVIYWGLNGVAVNTDTIYCPAFDTTYYELLY
ncbi:MAG: hypothetical protein WAU21_01480 [Chitinophagales bacterium]|nr:hypothetical protein [Bacteroidota bacterium]MBK8680634.1 hypothetical protein [Bacteroidota bacterium]